MNIQSLAQRYCEHARYMLGYSPDTIRKYRGIINLYTKVTGIESVEHITNKNMREFFLHGRTVRNWAPRTFVNFHMTLTVFFRWCVDNQFIKENPINGIEPPKIEYRIPAKLTKQDALKLLEVVYNYPYRADHLRYRNHAIFSLFLFAGLRRREILKLRHTDVDIPNRSIHIRLGKGNKDRIIPMSIPLAESLQRYVIERTRLKKTCPEFFTSLHKNIGLTWGGLKRIVLILRSATGINFSVHKLRHTFATLMLEGGCDIYSLSKMMGHSDIKTTTIYLSATVEHLRGQITKHPLNTISI